ncbi:phosphopyruvate hydratase [Gelria sp. Kuro-4]|uniref:phosphopyruvate hydratase n=1 Tax=Gelria sp. Kuro-4 TaxID=2796927 RepID=UPI001BF06074|nr:phosphopyruvate hydratase [Gelria sp. Kuro-4]BCV26057.1 phosphopyruvate hydratase [Gelria sp. Kuro-4]
MELKITNIVAREVLDCRGNPTVQVDVVVNDEILGRADVPAGKSTGAHEAQEVRDGGKRFGGLGVQKAIAGVAEEIAPALRGRRVTDQRALDQALIALDGTPNKARLGANAILGVSLAAARAAAAALRVPLYKYINVNAHVLPVPLLNYINGGKHASNDLEFQEFCIFPVGAETFKEAMEIGWAVYEELRTIIIDKYGKIAANVGDEGGFAPPIVKVREALDNILLAVKRSGYEEKIVYGLDCAATHLYDPETGKYHLEGNLLSTDELLAFYKDLLKSYPIVTIEDPFSEDDVDGFVRATQELGIQIVGDDFFCTNPARIKERAALGAGNALLWKVNQIGTLSEALDAAELAYRHSFGVMVSERSGETEDPIISDLVVGINAGQIKTGAAVRGERTAKYNRLLQIEEELGSCGAYAGGNFKTPF